MGLLSSAFKSLGSIVKKALPTVASIAIPGAGGLLVGGALEASSVSKPIASYTPKSTAPAISPGTPNIPVPGFGGTMQRLLPGGQTGYLSSQGPRGYHLGKITGQPVRNGFREAMSPDGTVYWQRKRRRRGITARDLQNFKRVHRQLKQYSKMCK